MLSGMVPRKPWQQGVSFNLRAPSERCNTKTVRRTEGFGKNDV
jgi:hypothetical protein